MKRKRPYPLTDDEICTQLVKLFTTGLPVVDTYGKLGRSTTALFGRSLSKALQLSAVMKVKYPVYVERLVTVEHPSVLREYLVKRCVELGTPGVMWRDRHYMRRVVDLIEMAEVRVGLGEGRVVWEGGRYRVGGAVGSAGYTITVDRRKP